MELFNSRDITKDSLVIIGNGFDLAHGLKTSYFDFHAWLLAHGQEHFVKSMESIFYTLKGVDDKDLWSDFESALGVVDIDFTRQMYQDEHKGKDVFDEVVEPTILLIGTHFKNWIESIDTSTTKPILSLPTNARYLTFNYTNTLESVYRIPQKQILHIHGCHADGETLIYGCQNDPVPLSVLDKEESDDLQYIIRYKTADLLNDSLKKNTTALIRENHAFFESFSDVRDIFVIGHSLARVDWPYFLEIQRHIARDASWQITYHNTKDKIKLQTNLPFQERNNINFKRL